MTKCVSPWYNHTGWLGVNHQFTYLLALHKLSIEEALKKKKKEEEAVPLIHAQNNKPKKQQWGTIETTKTCLSRASLSDSFTRT